jgi:hypothetical protein
MAERTKATVLKTVDPTSTLFDTVGGYAKTL